MRLPALFLIVLVGLLAPGAPSPARAAPACQFVLGFATLHDLIPLPVGSCLEDEHHNPVNGDALQRTTGGLLVWRKADNFTAFTDGFHTWVDGPYGLQERLNDQRFSWEGRPSVVRVKPGPVYLDAHGDSWDNDDGSISSYLYTTYLLTTTVPIAGTTDQPLYQSERSSESFTYTFFVLNGNYTLTLKFAEIYWKTPGHRRFRVFANGAILLDNFDILTRVPPNTALDESFPVAVTDGALTLTLTAELDRAKVSAIQLTPRG